MNFYRRIFPIYLQWEMLPDLINLPIPQLIRPGMLRSTLYLDTSKSLRLIIVLFPGQRSRILKLPEHREGLIPVNLAGQYIFWTKR